MKVWILLKVDTSHPFRPETFLGVFAEREKAETYRQSILNDWGKSHYTEYHVIEEPLL